jgi:hypothetical protein
VHLSSAARGHPENPLSYSYSPNLKLKTHSVFSLAASGRELEIAAVFGLDGVSKGSKLSSADPAVITDRHLFCFQYQESAEKRWETAFAGFLIYFPT